MGQEQGQRGGFSCQQSRCTHSVTANATVPPGLLAAGIGSLVYLGLGYLTGLSTSAYALHPLTLPTISHLTLADVELR